jgi:hypothetical protein
MGWLANLLICLSWYFTGEKDRIAFVLLGVGESYYVWNGAVTGQWDLAFICLACIAWAVRNWIKWGKA